MGMIQQFTSWFSKQKFSGKVAIGCVSGCVGLFMLCCLCSIPVAILSPSKPASKAASTTIPIVATLPPTPTLVPEFSYADIIQSANEKGWTSTQYSAYRETIKGKQVNGWSGTILEIKEWAGEPYLSLDMKEGEPLIDAYIYISKDDVLKVGLGQNVTFSGTIDDDWPEANDFYSLQIKNVKLLKLGEIPTPTPIPTLQLTPTLQPTPMLEPIPTATAVAAVSPTKTIIPTIAQRNTPALTPTEKVSAIIPGLKPADVTVNLEQRGFTCSSVQQGQLYYSRTCNKDTGNYSVRVDIFGRELFSIDFIDSSVIQFANVDNELSATYLGFIATMPYDGAVQQESRNWVKATVPTIKKGNIAEKVFAGVKYTLKGIPTFITLEMGDLP
jgi:hypothetical protein